MTSLRTSILIVIATLLFSSCDKTDEDLLINKEPDITIESIIPNDDSNLLSILANFGSVDSNAKMLDSGFGNISLDEAIKVTNPYRNLERYSLLIKSDNNSFGFENLVLREIEGEVLPYIIKFDPDLHWLYQNEGVFDITTLTGELAILNLDRALLFEASYINGRGYNIRDYLMNSSSGRINCGGSSGTGGGSSGGPSGGGVGNTGGTGGSGNTGGSTGNNGSTSGSGGSSCVWGTTATGGIFIDCREQNMGLHFFKTLCDPYGYVDLNDCAVGDCPIDPIGILPRQPINLSELIKATRIITLTQLIQDDPFALIENCDQIEQWQELVQHNVPGTVLQKLEFLQSANNSVFGGDWNVQNINDAEGPVVNMDYFSVRVTQLPKNPDTGQSFAPDSFFNHVRKNLDDFLEGNSTEFGSYNSAEDDLWKSNDYLGAIMRFEIKPEILGGTIPASQDGTVICSDKNNKSWKFTTLESPDDWNHPVSGHREFGLVTNADGSYTFYTRGVDRVAEAFDQFAGDLPFGQTAFEGADKLWTTFQNNLESYINAPGRNGFAQIETPKIDRTDWDKIDSILKGETPVAEIGCD
ncbi:MAG: hypothetical protein JXR07_15345 [Reichenbachiella sp.]